MWSRPSRSSGAAAPGLVLLFGAALLGAVFLHRLPALVAGSYLVFSLVTFATYAGDKAAAKASRWRIAESRLHLLALAGGWPGALLAQSLLRHKSQKTSFLLGFWVTVVLNCGLLVWLAAAKDAAALRSLLGGGA